MVVCWTVGLFAITAAVCAAPSVSQSEIEKRLTGTWIGVSGDWGTENSPAELRSFTFTTNHQCEATVCKEILTGTFRITVSNEPYQMDFTFEVQGKKVMALTIFDFPKEGHLRIAEWDPDFRRKEFKPSITLKKKESSNQ